MEKGANVFYRCFVRETSSDSRRSPGPTHEKPCTENTTGTQGILDIYDFLRKLSWSIQRLRKKEKKRPCSSGRPYPAGQNRPTDAGETDLSNLTIPTFFARVTNRG